MNSNKLPNDPTAIVLAIIGLILILLGCCCGLFAVVSLVLGIAALVMANKAIREYALHPHDYDPRSYKAMHTAKVLGIVGIVLSAIIMTAQAIFFAVNGEQITQDFWRGYDKGFHREWRYESSDDDGDQDTETWDETDGGDIRLKKQGDSIVVDSTAIDSVNQKI